MAIARCFAATAMLTGLALGLAAPASAQNEMSGHYIENQTDQSTGQPVTLGGQPVINDWYFTPCGDGCASAVENGQPHGQAQLVNGQWTIDSGGPVTCADGTNVPNALSSHRTWDPNTLAGRVQETFNVPACGNAAGYQYTNNIQFTQTP